MEVSRVHALRGPNLWSRHTAIEAIVACRDEERSISDMPGFEARLRARFPEISFLEPATHAGATSMAQVLELATLGLQAQAGCPVTFSRTAATAEPGVYQVVVEYTEEAVGRLALGTGPGAVPGGRRGHSLRSARRARRPARTRRGRAPRAQYGRHRRGRLARGIPFRRLNSGQPGAVRLGQPPAPHPGGGNRPHERDRGIHRPGQGTHQEAARCRRRAGARRPAGEGRRGRVGRGRAKSAARWS